MPNWVEVGGAGALILLGAYGVLKRTVGNLTEPVRRIEAELGAEKKEPAEPAEKPRLHETVEELQRSVSRAFENWSNKFERMEGNLDRVDSRLLVLEGKLERAADSRDAQGEVLDAQTKLLEDIDGRLQEVEKSIRNGGNEK